MEHGRRQQGAAHPAGAAEHHAEVSGRREVKA